MPSDANVLIVVETSGGSAREASLELLSAAKSLEPARVDAVVIGSGVSSVAEDVAGRGADKVYVADVPMLERYSTTGYEAAIEAAIEASGASVVLIAGTTSGRDLTPYLAAKRGEECLTDCIAFSLEGGRVKGTRPVYQGKMIADVSMPAGSPSFISVRSGVFGQPETGGSGEIQELELDSSSIDMPIEFVGLSQAKGGDTALEDADIVVAGGRGVGSAEQYQIILDLAEAIGGVVGATRAVTDLGWRPHHEQIGQTGANVRPRLYLGVGVSGAVQHAVGMQNSETIVAINRDADAPIFRMAEIGVIGDLHEIVPHLITELQSARDS
ncbi:MAG: electron transfer flavoprotein subunit alpha/FixB family protein [Thermomicrobiales bacterium]